MSHTHTSPARHAPSISLNLRHGDAARARDNFSAAPSRPARSRFTLKQSLFLLVGLCFFITASIVGVKKLVHPHISHHVSKRTRKITGKTKSAKRSRRMAEEF